jgi:hypothetical protein
MVVLPDTIFWIICAIDVAPEPLPRQPAHGRGPDGAVVQRKNSGQRKNFEENKKRKSLHFDHLSR